MTTGVFNQIPGVDFVWREITLSVPPAGADHARLRSGLQAAAIDVLADSREEIERQTRARQRSTASRHGGDIVPTVRLQFSSSCVEARIHYPVRAQHATEIEAHMPQALLRVIAADGSTAVHA